MATDKYGHSCLHHACIKGHLDIVQLLIMVNNVLLPTMASIDGETCLHVACHCRKEHADVVRELAKLGGDLLLAKDKDGHSCLHFACALGHLNVVKLLIGANDGFLLRIATTDSLLIARALFDKEIVIDFIDSQYQ